MFKRIVAHNFLSWENLEFEFTTGVTLIEGFNYDDQTSEGSGKSAILNALSWGLYGRVPKDAKIDDVIRDGTKSCEVVIELDSGTKIVRTRKPNDLYIDAVERLKGKDTKETQLMVESLIGMSFETFLQSVYWAQNYPNKFVTATEEEKAKILSEILNIKQFDRARATTLQRLRDLELVSAGVEKKIASFDIQIMSIERSIQDFTSVKERLQRERDTRIKDLESQHADLVNQLNVLESNLSAQYLSDLSKEREDLVTVISEIEAWNSDLNSQLHKLSQISDLQRSKQKLEAALMVAEDKLTRVDSEEEMEAGLKSVRAELEELQARKGDIASKFLGVSQQKKLKDDIFRLQVRKLNGVKCLESDLVRLTSPENKKCPTCGTLLDSEADKEQIGMAIIKAEHSLRANRVELEGITKELESVVVLSDEELRRQLAVLSNEITQKQTLEKDIYTEKVHAQLLNREVREVRYQLSEITEKLAQFPELLTEAVVRGQINQASQAMKDARARDQELVQAIARFDGELKHLKLQQSLLAKLESDLIRVREIGTSDIDEKLNGFQVDRVSLKEERDSEFRHSQELRLISNRLQTLKDGFKEIKAFVFQNILGELTRKSNQYLAELFEVPTLIQFSNLSEDGEISKIQVDVTYDGISRSLGLYSGGQFRRIQLAVDLALSEIVSSRGAHPLQLRILDEYFKDLSFESMQKALALLEKLPGTTVLVEHNDIFKNIVQRIFTVELKNGISTAGRSA